MSSAGVPEERASRAAMPAPGGSGAPVHAAALSAGGGVLREGGGLGGGLRAAPPTGDGDVGGVGFGMRFGVVVGVGELVGPGLGVGAGVVSRLGGGYAGAPRLSVGVACMLGAGSGNWATPDVGLEGARYCAVPGMAPGMGLRGTGVLCVAGGAMEVQRAGPFACVRACKGGAALHPIPDHIAKYGRWAGPGSELVLDIGLGLGNSDVGAEVGAGVEVSTEAGVWLPVPISRGASTEAGAGAGAGAGVGAGTLESGVGGRGWVCCTFKSSDCKDWGLSSMRLRALLGSGVGSLIGTKPQGQPEVGWNGAQSLKGLPWDTKRQLPEPPAWPVSSFAQLGSESSVAQGIGGMFARRATFLLTIPTSAPDIPSDGEGAPNRP